MNKRTIIENEFLTLWYYPDEQIIHHEFHKYVYGAAFRDGLTRGTEIMETYGARKWLSDDRNNSALHPDDTEWGGTVWFPRVVKAGWKFWAIVMPSKVVGQMTMKRIINIARDLGVTAVVFEDPRRAMRWLMRQTLAGDQKKALASEPRDSCPP